MRRALIASALSIFLSALSIRALKIADVDTAITLQSVFGLSLIALALLVHMIKRKPE